MKKILTVSLFAMMAVSAANADIASTKFVTDRTGNTEFEGSVEGAADLTAAVNALAGKVDTVAGSGEGSVSDQINSALENYTNTAGMNSAIATAKGELTTEIGKVDDKADANAAAIEAADLTQVGADGSYISTVSQVNGKVSATAVAFKGAIAENETSANAPTAKAVYDHVASEMGALNSDLGELQTKVTNAQNGLSGLADEFDAYQTSNDAAVQQAQADATAAGTAAAAADSKAQGAVDTNATQQTAINKNASDLAAYKTANDAAVAKKANSADVYTKTEAETEFMDSDEVDAAIAGAVTGTNGVLKNYSTTEEMTTAITDANSAQTTAITNAYTAADSALETKITNAYKAADTATLDAAKADATTKANTAKNEAIAAAKSAGDEAYAAKKYETIVDANEAFREAIASGTTGSDGTYALTATVSGNAVSGYKWELIGR